jgi:uncharacterized protein
MSDTIRPLAIVTGASTGIGFELAGCCIRDGFDLIVAANEHSIRTALRELAALGGQVEAIETDLATPEGFNGRPVDALLANAGVGLGEGFSIRMPKPGPTSSTPTSMARCI